MAGAAVCAVDSRCVRASQKSLAIGIPVTCSNLFCVFDTSWLIFRCCSLLPSAIFSPAAAAACVSMAGFFVNLAGVRCGTHACSYGHVILFVLSAAARQPTRNLDIVDVVLLWYAFCFVIASAVVRRCSRTSPPACDKFFCTDKHPGL